jgi:hypothetical protein
MTNEQANSERAQYLASVIAGRLFLDGAEDLSDVELHRVLDYYGLAVIGKQLRDTGALSLAEEWIRARHYHSAGDDRGACMCATPTIDRVWTGANLKFCGEPDRPRAGCGKAIAGGSGTLAPFADVDVTLCEECTVEAGAPW